MNDATSYGCAYTQDPGTRYDSEDSAKGNNDIWNVVRRDAGESRSRTSTIDRVIAAVDEVLHGNDF
jgi:hypothetical protein